ncbi:hypothetical protein ACFSKN_12980 [Mariniflexile gromovii]|uniref:Nitrite reductase/ring-hydroxylating ferredoxin subunit n=1 Tax=Mariniflexile gromovii TaxID=362523 RepID=A0ABS4BW07_9FLAO|nr:hypothetical protein [Mariniflexile gromovii]MBP0904776.1 hypothetical protein [Mariniflexile gromovii]
MKSFLYIICFGLLTACSSDNVTQNPYLPNYQFNTGSLINTNLPQYSHLKFPNNSIVLNSPYGINGVVLFYAGGSNYNAFEITDPNHQISTCSKLSVEGFIASCNCDDGNSYDLLNGVKREGTTGSYPLIRYRVEISGSIIRIYNN